MTTIACRLALATTACLAMSPAWGAQTTAPKPAPKPAASKPSTPAAPGQVASVPAPAGPKPIVGSCHFSPIVSDLEAAIVFYQRVLGLQVPAPTGGGGLDNGVLLPRVSSTDGERPFDSRTPLLDMLGVRGAEMRWVTARIPGSRCGVEIVEIGKIDRRPLDPKPQDPGAATLVLIVRDVEPIFTRALNAGIPVLTTGGVPIAVPSEGGAGIVLREPDGHFVEVLQAIPQPAATAADGANIIGWRLRLTVESTENALRLYRDQFGLEAKAAPLAKNAAFTALNGLADVPVRITTLTLPGGGRLDLAEYSGVPRTPLGARIQDPGATRFQLQAADVRTAVDLATRAGATVMSQDGGIIALQGGVQATVVRDTSNLFLVLFSSPAQ